MMHSQSEKSFATADIEHEIEQEKLDREMAAKEEEANKKSIPKSLHN